MNSSHGPHPQHRRHRVTATLLTVVLVAAWLVVAGVLGGRASGTASSSAGSAAATELVPVASTSYVVQPGDTLWSVARSLQPSGELRPLVDRLARHTADGRLRAGQRIPLP